VVERLSVSIGDETTRLAERTNLDPADTFSEGTSFSLTAEAGQEVRLLWHGEEGTETIALYTVQ
jgi:hypothetical protein